MVRQGGLEIHRDRVWRHDVAAHQAAPQAVMGRTFGPAQQAGEFVGRNVQHFVVFAHGGAQVVCRHAHALSLVRHGARHHAVRVAVAAQAVVDHACQHQQGRVDQHRGQHKGPGLLVHEHHEQGHRAAGRVQAAQQHHD